MAGFLDRKTRVIDMVITSHGKRLLSTGELHFCYWVPFDDEINYDPYIAESGSLSAEQLSSSIYQSIETTPIREATLGYRNFNSSGSDHTNVNRPMFTVTHGQENLPKQIIPTYTSGIGNDGRRISRAPFEITTKQRRVQRVYPNQGSSTPSPVDIGVERFDAQMIQLDFSYTRDSFSKDTVPEGFRVVVLRSGSSGYYEVNGKRDLLNDLSYNNDLKVFTGRE